MSKVVVHRFEVYDITNDAIVQSRRYGTADAIKNIANGRIMPNTQIEVDASELGHEIEGMTARGYIPASELAAPPGQFQNRVLRYTDHRAAGWKLDSEAPFLSDVVNYIRSS